MEIKVLGTGVTNCKTKEKASQDEIAELDFDANIFKKEDIDNIMGYGIGHTPTPVLDGISVFCTRVSFALKLNHNH